jgi:glycosyltransferase involved in cell wall biosynthesis
MFSDKITFVIFMYNEEARVERAVRNFTPYGRVLIVDCFSTDRTCDIATSLGAEIFKHQNNGSWVEDEETTTIVKAAVKTSWLYWGFADEIVDRATMDQMIDAIESGRYSIVNIARKNYYYGKFTGDAYRNTQNRAFKKDAIDFRGNTIHHFGTPTVPDSEIAYLDPKKYFVHHFISNTAKVYLASLDRYTDVEARNTSTPSPLRMVGRMLRGFLGHYYLRGGRKAGRAGFYLGLQMAFYNVLLAMKSYEREQDLDTLSIEARNNVVRDRLLRELETK